MNIDARPSVIFLMGPTASGKTALAVALSQQFNLEIVSVDSAMVYRGFNIGAAKPTAEILKRSPHALIDIRDPNQSYSAAEFRNDALYEMERIRKLGRVPLLVGGTGLYFRALERGLSNLPDADPQIRHKLAQQASENGWDWMHQRLAALDSQTALRIHPNDPQRIQRALEVIELTGSKLSELQKGGDGRFKWRLLKLAMVQETRSVLHERIEKRLESMLEQGFIDEVRLLKQSYSLNDQHTAMRAVGYRQIGQYLDGQFPLTELSSKMVAATRQLAKRQLTWLRSEHDAISVNPDSNVSGLRIAAFLGP
jgi:tRNA dimethylallyltransferase